LPSLQRKKFMFLHCWLKVRHCPKFLEVETNKRPWSRSSTPSEDAAEEEGNPVSARPRIEKTNGKEASEREVEDRSQEMLDHSRKPLQN
jgi:hypothetical protein